MARKKEIRGKPAAPLGKVVSGVPYSTDGETPIWVFDMLDRQGPFSFDLARRDFDHRAFLEKMIAYSGMTWARIKAQTHDNGKSKHHFLSLNALSRAALERIKDRRLDEAYQESIFSFALQNKLRVIGIREGRLFHVVWYDPDHAFCPSRK